MGPSFLGLLLAAACTFLSVQSMVIPLLPDSEDSDVELSNNLTPANPPIIASNGTAASNVELSNSLITAYPPVIASNGTAASNVELSNSPTTAYPPVIASNGTAASNVELSNSLTPANPPVIASNGTAASEHELSNSLTSTYLPIIASNSTAQTRRKRCGRQLIIIFYSRTTSLPGGNLRAAPSRIAAKLTQAEGSPLQRCLQMYGDISHLCTGLSNSSPLIDGSSNENKDSALLRKAQRMIE